jgi:2-desacetyl-2-hydroxyethyl bacteriochlorophyllide A dehydrogenase
MNALHLRFAAPRAVEVQTRPVPEPPRDGLCVATRLSAISAGTEMLIFRGQFPENMPLDETLPSLAGRRFAYPVAYGYSCVGRVTAVGARVDPAWIGRRVFAFHPHASHFIARPEALIPLPEGLASEDAVFLAGMETAVNLVLDGRPLIGERVVVVGQGIVGLLTTALLARHPLKQLIGVDRLPLRRETALAVGADRVLPAMDEDPPAGDGAREDADLIYELSGNPRALNLALRFCGFDSRIVIGSWYGKNAARVDLGGSFHRDRVRIVSSQVSTLGPEVSGRWTTGRRLALALEMLGRLEPSRFISHRFPAREAQKAYERIDRRPADTLQVVLEYAD